MSLYLDTHVLVWLYEGLTEQFSQHAVRLIEENELLISPVVQLELVYLHETKKITRTAHSIVLDLQHRIGLQICDTPFENVIDKATSLTWTRDPFDRIIVAQAMCVKSKLLTKDKVIRSHYKLAVWD